MPLNIPNLDDRTFEDLVAEALTRIPVIAPQWTNHNASDPGITLVEMLAYVTEILIYRVNRVSDSHLKAFLRLITATTQDGVESPVEKLREAILDIRRTTRAVTCADYEELARDKASGQVARTHCIPLVNLESAVASGAAPTRREGHISVVVVPVRRFPLVMGKPDKREWTPEPSPQLLEKIRSKLEECRLVTTRLHVVGPRYVPVRISMDLTLVPNASEPDVRRDVSAAVLRLLDPVGLAPAPAWPFGRTVHVSELFDLVERQTGVDYVSKLTLSSDEPRRIMRNAAGDVVGISLFHHELPAAEIDRINAHFLMSTFGD